MKKHVTRQFNVTPGIGDGFVTLICENDHKSQQEICHTCSVVGCGWTSQGIVSTCHFAPTQRPICSVMIRCVHIPPTHAVKKDPLSRKMSLMSILRKTLRRSTRAVRNVGRATRSTLKSGTNAVGLTGRRRRRRRSHRKH